MDDEGCVKTGTLKWKLEQLCEDKNRGRRELCKYGDPEMEDGRRGLCKYGDLKMKDGETA